MNDKSKEDEREKRVGYTEINSKQQLQQEQHPQQQQQHEEGSQQNVETIPPDPEQPMDEMGEMINVKQQLVEVGSGLRSGTSCKEFGVVQKNPALKHPSIKYQKSFQCGTLWGLVT